jgi:hypothetical protein
MKMKNIFLLACVSFLSSCNFVDIPVPTDRIVSNGLFENDKTANAAVLGLYNRLGGTTPPFSNGATTIYTGLTSDELTYTATANVINEFYQNNISSNNSLILSAFWRGAYETIYHANACIEGLESSTQVSTNIQSILLGESYFLRAFCYWYLFNLFGDVPLVITTDYSTNSGLPRAEMDLVQKQIYSDLLKAKDLLKSEYPSEGKFRVNYYTVLALLSRYYLHQNNWQECERISSEIINSNLYQIESDINKVFLSNSAEAIWQLATSSPSFNTVEGNWFIPTNIQSSRPEFALTQSLMNSFEVGDLRFVEWTASKEIQGTVYTYPFKYKIRSSTLKTEGTMLFRLAEIYLNRAEAKYFANDLEGAFSDLNILRNRAGLVKLNIQNTLDVYDAIQKERQVELFVEGGSRWFDLKRTGKIDETLGQIKPNWNSNWSLFPIPMREILVNTRLTQNEGYDR